MRAGRLMAVLLHVQRTGRATAPELAASLEVSVRTIYRDVAALQEAGVPLWTEPGHGGGIRLVSGWRFPLDGLSGDEAAALVLGAGPTGASELGLGAVLAVAQSKVLSALPQELRARTARMQERFLVDAPGWFQREEPLPHLATVADGVWSGARLDIEYHAGRRPVRRRVDPLGLVLKAGVWYLVAAHRGTPRTYRASRIAAATRLDAVAVRPEGFDLARWWDAAGAAFDRSILHLGCTLLVEDRAVGRLRSLVPGATTEAALAGAGEPDERGRRRVELRVESVEVAVSQLAPLGGAVEVLEPPALRAALAGHGAALAARNAPPPRVPATSGAHRRPRSRARLVP